ncbi:MAG: thiamine pyrophosphokinase [Bacteroidales bacterium]|nr:thiamine pyrophosphokinase [Bacteroidales bacterium]
MKATENPGSAQSPASAVILCNGEFPRKEYPLYLLRSADIIICCDSARNVDRLARLGLTPSLIVGDMDSTPARIQKEFASRIVKVHEQDDNDLAKAFSLLRERYPEVIDIHILGAGGKNEAHTVGNLGWLLEWERRSLAETGLGLAARGISVDMVSDWSTAFAVSPSNPATSLGSAPSPEPGCNLSAAPLDIYVGEGRRISFFATDPQLRIKSQGLQWPLDGVDLSRWWCATLNRATSDTVTLAFNHPAPLLIILD